MDMNRIKILPLLVVVAMLAFSVRLVEFSLGVSELSGRAMAAKTESESPSVVEGAKEVYDAKDAGDAKPRRIMKKKTKEDESIDWRDAKDEGAGDSGVRESVLGDIAKRRKELDEKERGLVTREALLKASKQELEQKYKELVLLRTQIEELLGRQSEEEKKRIDSLVKIYEGMKPKDAARIFDTLDLDVLVSVMSKMSERKLSPILASMSPERARTVTIMLAEEKQLPDMP